MNSVRERPEEAQNDYKIVDTSVAGHHLNDDDIITRSILHLLQEQQ